MSKNAKKDDKTEQLIETDDKASAIPKEKRQERLSGISVGLALALSLPGESGRKIRKEIRDLLD